MSEPTQGSGSFDSDSQSRGKLPPRPSGEFLRKLAKDRLHEMRAGTPSARLFEAQLAVAREHGFGSWRELAAHLNAGGRGTVKRQGARVEIEGVEPLFWFGSDCTYIQAMVRALSVVGPARDYATLMGDSGLAFRARYWASDDGTTGCPSSPVGEMQPWIGFTERSVGWKMRFEVRMKPGIDDPHDMTDLLDEVKQNIDAGLPVLGYFKQWDMGVAYGYEGDKLLIRDFWVGKKEELIDVSACKGLVAFFEERTAVPTKEASARFAVREAVSRWTATADRGNRNGKEGAYYYGHQAFDQWTSMLGRAGEMSEEQRKRLLHVNYWTYISLHDARQKAAVYLRGVAEFFGAQSADVLRAADIYQKIGEITGKVIHDGAIFLAFYVPTSLGKWDDAMRRKEIELLEQIRQMDEEAVVSLKKT